MGLVSDQVSKVSRPLGWSVKIGKLLLKVNRSHGFLAKVDKVFSFALDHVNTAVSWGYIIVKAVIVSQQRAQKCSRTYAELSALVRGDEGNYIVFSPRAVKQAIVNAPTTDKTSAERIAAYIFVYQCLLLQENQEFELIESLLDESNCVCVEKAIKAFYSSGISWELVEAVKEVEYNKDVLTNNGFLSLATMSTEQILTDLQGKAIRGLLEWVV